MTNKEQRTMKEKNSNTKARNNACKKYVKVHATTMWHMSTKHKKRKTMSKNDNNNKQHKKCIVNHDKGKNNNNNNNNNNNDCATKIA